MLYMCKKKKKKQKKQKKKNKKKKKKKKKTVTYDAMCAFLMPFADTCYIMIFFCSNLFSVERQKCGPDRKLDPFPGRPIDKCSVPN